MIRNLTGSLAEFSMLTCENLSMPIRQAACEAYKTGFACGAQILLSAFTQCTSSGEFDGEKFARLMKPFLEDLDQHCTP
jgi:hypothetical protein